LSTVTNLTDHDPGSLRDAIATTPPGGTVDFQAGLSGTIPLSTGELMIGKDLTVTGPGASVITVSGSHASRVFNIATTFTVDISGLTIANGSVTGFNTNGGGIQNFGTLTVVSSTLSGNSASNFGGGIWNSGTVTVTNSTLSGNSARNFGGGIFNAATATITSSTLSGNSAFAGGGIFNAATATITSSTLSGNSAGNGGGIVNAGTLTVTNSTLSGNSAVFNGGGIWGGPGGTVNVTNSTLSGNSARNFGGGIFNAATATVTNSTLSGNSASEGGGIYIAEGPLMITVTLTSCTLSGNSASFGGGIVNFGTLTVTSSTLSSNSASLEGGGILNVTLTSTVTLTSSTLSGNSSGLDGGGILNGGTLTITSSTVSSNTAVYGGGIYNAFSSALTVTSTTVSGNSARLIGGGIYGTGMVTITRSTLSSNTGDLGGGIYGNGVLTITSSTVSGNSASSGGGIFNSFALTITSSTVSGNSANVGGGIDGVGGPVITKNVILAGNIAALSPDIAGLQFSQGHNLIGDGTGGSGFTDTDLVGTAAFPIDVQLQPLSDYGGPTQTMRPLPGSPVINAGDNTDAPDTDQRGFPRIVLDFIDIGAVELQPSEFGPRSRESLLIPFGKLVSGSWGSVVETRVSPLARQEVTELLQHVDTTVRRAKDLVFGGSHRAQRPVPASGWETNELFV
jgi:predicted outer membrane repeat protein